MPTRNIDFLNTGLIVLSAILAYIFPLELLVVSFAVLGPLHYLTEINWLEKKHFFANGISAKWLWIGLAVTAFIVVPRIVLYMDDSPSSFTTAMIWTTKWSNVVLFSTLVTAFTLPFVRQKRAWIISAISALVLAIFLNQAVAFQHSMGIFVPTIIHVYLFTIFFMAYGTKRSKSKLGILNVVLIVLVPIAYSMLEIMPSNYQFADEIKGIYIENQFHETPLKLASYIGVLDGKSFLFYGVTELKLMMFISFAYFYHYLNWFSKTTVIKWHTSLSKTRGVFILVFWIILSGLFYLDYALGFIVALFFSMLHVILEFPLNAVSVKELFSKN